MNKISFLTEKELAAANAILTTLASIPAHTDGGQVSHLAQAYSTLVGAAACRHASYFEKVRTQVRHDSELEEALREALAGGTPASEVQ